MDRTITTTTEWRKLLQKWSDEWLGTNNKFSPCVRKNRWLGYKPATDKQIAALQKRLGYSLPPSLCAFLKTSNGWRRTSSFILRIRSVTKIQWLEVEDPQFLDIWDEFEETCFGKYGGISRKEYFSYTPKASEVFDKNHFKTSLLLSDPVIGDSSMYLLNPMIVTEDGEWEAWFYAHWIPGVKRYPSFSHLILEEYESFRLTELNNKRAKRVVGPFKGVYAPDKHRYKAECLGPGKSRPRRLTIEELVGQLKDLSPKIRKEAAKQLIREFKPHDPNKEYPLLVEPLSDILHSSLEYEVRCAATYMLGTYGNEEAIEPLVRGLEDSAVASAVVGALFYLNIYYKSTLISDGLCRYLSVPRDCTSTMSAIHILEEYCEPRLESIALRILDSDTDKQVRFTAAFALARISDSATDELIHRLKNKNAGIREAAAAAIRKTEEHRAISALKEALADKDPNVRMQVEISLQFLQDN